MKRQFKNGDIVSVKNHNDNGRTICVALYVDISKNSRFIAGDRNGIYFFRGKWYGNNPLNIRSFGKVQGMQGDQYAYKIGTVRKFRNPFD